MRTAFEQWLLTQPPMTVPEAEAAWSAWQAGYAAALAQTAEWGRV